MVARRRWVAWLWLPVLFVLVAVGLWWMGHPAALPLADRTVTASAKVEQRVYVGVTVDGSVDRELAISKAAFRTAGDSTNGLDADGLEVEAWICRDGAISQTTAPDRFCDDVIPAEGNSLRLGNDQLMVSIQSTAAVALHLEPVELTFRDGLQRGTDPFGPEYEFVVIG